MWQVHKTPKEILLFQVTSLICWSLFCNCNSNKIFLDPIPGFLKELENVKVKSGDPLKMSAKVDVGSGKSLPSVKW